MGLASLPTIKPFFRTMYDMHVVYGCLWRLWYRFYSRVFVISWTSRERLLFCFRITPPYFPVEAWRFIASFVSSVVQTHMSQSSIISDMLCSSGLTRSAICQECSCALLGFKSNTQLQMLRDLLGQTVTYGIRGRRPKLGKLQSIRENDAINVVNVGHNTAEFPFHRRTVKQGIDLGYDG
jgi:hypothetical protein